MTHGPRIQPVPQPQLVALDDLISVDDAMRLIGMTKPSIIRLWELGSIQGKRLNDRPGSPIILVRSSVLAYKAKIAQ